MVGVGVVGANFFEDFDEAFDVLVALILVRKLGDGWRLPKEGKRKEGEQEKAHSHGGILSAAVRRVQYSRLRSKLAGNQGG